MLHERQCSQFFERAYDFVEKNFPEDIEYTRGRSPRDLQRWTSQRFMEQYCWVVYAAGFKQATIKKKFPDLRRVFHDFDLNKMWRMGSLDAVLKIFNSKRKARCAVEGAKKIQKEGFDNFKQRILDETEEQRPDILRELPGIGEITKDQLAKDIGVTDVHKKDIWVQKLADLLANGDDAWMIQYLCEKYGDKFQGICLKKALIDSILFRFCSQEVKRVEKLVGWI